MRKMGHATETTLLEKPCRLCDTTLPHSITSQNKVAAPDHDITPKNIDEDYIFPPTKLLGYIILTTQDNLW